VAITILFMAAIAGACVWRWHPWKIGDTPHDDAYVPLPWPGRVMCWLAVAVYVLLWLIAFSRPDFSFDGNYYHIPTIHFWAREGYIHWIRPDYTVENMYANGIENIWNPYPHAVELVAFVLFQATRVNNSINVANLLFLPLGVLGVGLLARLLGAGTRSAGTAALALVLIPSVIVQGPSTLVDAAFTCSCIAAMALLYLALSNLAGRTVPWRLLVPLGGACGLALGAKTSGAPWLAFSLTGLGIAAVIGIANSANRGCRKQFVVRTVAFLGLCTALAGAVGGYWYAVNYIEKGNPLYPLRVTIGGHELLPGAYTRDRFADFTVTDALRPMGNVARAVRIWMGKDGRGAGTFAWYLCEGGMSPLWLYVCLPFIGLGLVWACAAWVSRHRVLWPAPVGTPTAFLVLIAVVGATFLAIPTNWQARHVIWLYGIGLPCLAVALSVSNRRAARYGLARRAIGIWAGVGLILLVVSAMDCLFHVHTRARLDGQPRLAAAPFRVMDNFFTCDKQGYVIPEMRDTLYARIVEDDRPVIFFAKENRVRLLGQLCQPIGRREVILADKEELKNPEQLQNLIKRFDVGYILWDNQFDVPGSIQRLNAVAQLIPNGCNVYDLTEDVQLPLDTTEADVENALILRSGLTVGRAGATSQPGITLQSPTYLGADEGVRLVHDGYGQENRGLRILTSGTPAFGLDPDGNGSFRGSITSLGGTLTAGIPDTAAGTIIAWDGKGRAQPGCVALAAPNGVLWYLSVDNTGALHITKTRP